MPELTPESSAAPPTVTPPAYDWEDHPAFRFTFLMHFTQNGDRLVLEHIGAMLYDLALEAGGRWPVWRESTTRAELRAVAADLRHAEGFLLAVAKERETASLGVEDERLSFQAAHYANECNRIAFGLESIVGPPWAPRPVP
jgi:hypothetical protein